MKRLCQTGILMLVLLISLLPTSAFCLENKETLQTVDQLLNRGENQQASQLLQELPEGTEGKLCRMARLQYEIGQITEPESDRPVFFRQAEKYARAAIAADPNNSEGYKWLAIALGAQAKYSTIKVQIKQSREIKKNIEKAIELNPDDDVSYHVLGRWNYKIAMLGFFSQAMVKIVYGGLPKASLKKAESLLLHAIKLHDRIAHRYNLAKVYDGMGRRKDAVGQLRQALTLPVTFPEENILRYKAKRKLRKWQ